MTAASRRLEAIERLVEIADGTWSPEAIAARPASVEVLVRKALRAATTHDDPEPVLAEIRDLAPIAGARTEPLIDATLHGLPELEQAPPVVTVEQLREALS